MPVPKGLLFIEDVLYCCLQTNAPRSALLFKIAHSRRFLGQVWSKNRHLRATILDVRNDYALNPNSRRALDVYLIEREKMAASHNIETPALFFTVRDRYSKTGKAPLNVRSVGSMLLHMTKVRPAGRCTPTCYATRARLKCSSTDVRSTSSVLGHDNLDVTAHYAQASTRLMMQTYNQAHSARTDLDVEFGTRQLLWPAGNWGTAPSPLPPKVVRIARLILGIELVLRIPQKEAHRWLQRIEIYIGDPLPNDSATK